MTTDQPFAPATDQPGAAGDVPRHATDPLRAPPSDTPPPATGPARFLSHQEPGGVNLLFVLSAMCMLAGLFTLNDSLSWKPIAVPKLLGLVATLAVYELLLTGLGVWLYRLRQRRDATTLFLLEAGFVSDVAFLNSEVLTQSLPIGLAVNAVVLTLALLKLALILRTLGLPALGKTTALVGGQLALLALAPAVLKVAWSLNPHGDLDPRVLYAAWWAAGLVPVAIALLSPWRSPDSATVDSAVRRHPRVIGAFVALPLLSLLAHLATSHWVYRVHWTPATLAPLVLGLAAAAALTGKRSDELRQRFAFVLPLLAIALTWGGSRELVTSLPFGFSLTPLRLVLLGAAAVYVVGLLRYRSLPFAIAVGTGVAAVPLGGTPGEVFRTLAWLAEQLLKQLDRLVPRTASDWGVLAIIASFVLLGVGLATSLARAKRQPPPAGG
jgi:hypothetical protein